ncbi:MAG: M20/M25/M40 family metallo-hydrolase, partial [Clostridia bacterium]|nr:M20/M25/M40 family metallo-hydrolase [Clostridia bacterium]
STLEKDYVLNALSQIGHFEILSYQAPLFSEKDSGLVKILSDIFKEATGIAAEPIAIGGGTYARALKKGVAFGPALNEEEAFSIHQANEHVTLTTLDLMTEIYLATLLKICC